VTLPGIARHALAAVPGRAGAGTVNALAGIAEVAVARSAFIVWSGNAAHGGIARGVIAPVERIVEAREIHAALASPGAGACRGDRAFIELAGEARRSKTADAGAVAGPALAAFRKLRRIDTLPLGVALLAGLALVAGNAVAAAVVGDLAADDALVRAGPRGNAGGCCRRCRWLDGCGCRFSGGGEARRGRRRAGGRRSCGRGGCRAFAAVLHDFAVVGERTTLDSFGYARLCRRTAALSFDTPAPAGLGGIARAAIVHDVAVVGERAAFASGRRAGSRGGTAALTRCAAATACLR
jgi:hypothetical protein